MLPKWTIIKLYYKSSFYNLLLKHNDGFTKLLQIEGETYEFRVRAINAGGVSEASNVVGPITCKARNVRPRIDRNAMMEIRCRAGADYLT